MNSKKRGALWTTMLLFAALTLLFAACGGSQDEAEEAAPTEEAVPTEAPAATEEPVATEEPTAEPEPEPTEEPAAETAAEPEMVESQVFVDSVEVENRDGDYFVTTIGNVPDSCTTLTGADVENDGNTILVTINAVKPADAVCAQVLTPFELEVPLNAADDLAPGEYTLDVNGASTTFTVGAEADTGSDSPASDLGSLAGTTWTLQTLNGDPALAVRPATLTFGENGSLTGQTGCNNFTGAYEVDGDALTLNVAGASETGCPQVMAQQESDYYDALAAVAGYAIDGIELQLSDADGNVIATFTSTQSAALQGTSWFVVAYVGEDGEMVDILEDTVITALFDGATINGATMCASYVAEYKIDGNTMTIQGMAGETLGAPKTDCVEPGPIKDQEALYRSAFEATASYRIHGVLLELSNAEGNPVLLYVASAATE